jgi:hypothetical protein
MVHWPITLPSIHHFDGDERPRPQRLLDLLLRDGVGRSSSEQLDEPQGLGREVNALRSAQ